MRPFRRVQNAIAKAVFAKGEAIPTLEPETPPSLADGSKEFNKPFLTDSERRVRQDALDAQIAKFAADNEAEEARINELVELSQAEWDAQQAEEAAEAARAAETPGQTAVAAALEVATNPPPRSPGRTARKKAKAKPSKSRKGARRK